MTSRTKIEPRCNQNRATAARGAPVEPLNTEILEVTGARESAVCKLGSIISRGTCARGNCVFEKNGAHRGARVATPDGSRNRLAFYPLAAPGNRTCVAAESDLGPDGLQSVFKSRRPSTRGRPSAARSMPRRYFSRAAHSSTWPASRGAALAFEDTRPAGAGCQLTPWGIAPEHPDRLGDSEEEAKRQRFCATACSLRSRRRHHASTPGLRMHRTATVQSLQARNLSGDFIHDQRLSGTRTRFWVYGPPEMSRCLKVSDGSVRTLNACPSN